MTTLTDPIYTNEEAARAHFEAIRWADGRNCPHCGTVGNSTLLKGKTTRAGLYKCKDCRKPFTATMGTIYERSHIPLHKWLLATYLLCSSKKGMSAMQLHRMLGFGSYRTAWFMGHRIREAMRSDDVTPMGSDGGDVFADETYFGRNPDAPKSRTPFRNLNQILTLVDRTTGRSVSMVFDGTITTANLAPILEANIAKEARLLTDEARHYSIVGKGFAAHGTVAHARGEYVSRADRSITTNQIEGFFGIFKRGMRGIYQHCGKQHLQRYLAEFDFRYTNRIATGCNDTDRTTKAIAGTVGRRLTYARPNLARA
ncbi:ISXO2-like transposase domain-containing protein [Sphingomonas antarctica]|uniref:IS1595 family transposase n=1 Tax=Sphingomonas antarctica TaxID=2040274 RepID=UPI0039ECC30D